MRATFIALARRYGAPSLAELFAACGVSDRCIFRLERRIDPVLVAAAEVCLGDPRLRVWQTPAHRRRRASSW
jgi:hypothetical protein